MSLILRFIEIRRVIDNYWDHEGPEPTRDMRQEMVALREFIPQKLRMHIVGLMKSGVRDEDIVTLSLAYWKKL